MTGRLRPPVSRPRDADTLLRGALARAAAAAAIGLEVTAGDAMHWASATFAGARHTLHLALTADDERAIADWLATLPDYPFALPGHLIADLKIVATTRDATGCRVVLEVLSVEDG